jgi:hypothetical protein
MTTRADRTWLFFIDRIEESSYPVTETGYALLYRAWQRSQADGSQIYVAYPGCAWSEAANGDITVAAQRVVSFNAEPYAFYRSQRENYQAGADIGSTRCHEEEATAPLRVNGLAAVVWRQETGDPLQMRALLEALDRVERDTVVYLSPKLALDPRFGSKIIPHSFDAKLTPRTYHTNHPDTEQSLQDKATHVRAFIRQELGTPQTVIAKPLFGNNGIGIHVVGLDPVTGRRNSTVDDLQVWLDLITRYGDLVVQEYVPSVRSPVGNRPEDLRVVPRSRCDFGEIRFLLIDGEIPRTAAGQPILVARRVPSDNSLIADSGISYATQLSDAELAFLSRLGPVYRRMGIYFGGGDLIRTADPARPFVFTDAARSVCGHAVVTGALNGDPYLVVDQILDSVARHISAHAGAALHTAPASPASKVAS